MLSSLCLADCNDDDYDYDDDDSVTQSIAQPSTIVIKAPLCALAREEPYALMAKGAARSQLALITYAQSTG